MAYISRSHNKRLDLVPEWYVTQYHCLRLRDCTGSIELSFFTSAKLVEKIGIDELGSRNAAGLVDSDDCDLASSS